MIFGTWRSYFISWQIFENKVWCPVSKKIRRYFHFLLSLTYPIDRLDWSLFSAVILFHHWFPLLEKIEIRAYILPRNFPAILIIFRGWGGEPPHPHRAGRAGNPPPSLPAGRVVRPWWTIWPVWFSRKLPTSCLSAHDDDDYYDLIKVMVMIIMIMMDFNIATKNVIVSITIIMIPW